MIHSANFASENLEKSRNFKLHRLRKFVFCSMLRISLALWKSKKSNAENCWAVLNIRLIIVYLFVWKTLIFLVIKFQNVLVVVTSFKWHQKRINVFFKWHQKRINVFNIKILFRLLLEDEFLLTFISLIPIYQRSSHGNFAVFTIYCKNVLISNSWQIFVTKSTLRISLQNSPLVMLMSHTATLNDSLDTLFYV